MTKRERGASFYFLILFISLFILAVSFSFTYEAVSQTQTFNNEEIDITGMQVLIGANKPLCDMRNGTFVREVCYVK